MGLGVQQNSPEPSRFSVAGQVGFFGGEGLYPLVMGKYKNCHEQLNNAFQNSFLWWNGE